MENKDLILPLGFFPEAGWYTLAQQGYACALVDPAQYPAARQTLLRGPNGIQTLRIPLEKKRPGQIADVAKWKRETLQAIRTAYGTAPFYPFYDYLVAEAMESTQSFEALCLRADALCRMVLNLEPVKPSAVFKGVWPELPVLAYDYGQRFTDQYAFNERVSILDVIFNAGPLSCEVIAGKRL